MSDNIKRMNIKEFREAGFLQELNRLFLHPLGLALEVDIDDDGNETLGGIWDYRDDEGGNIYGSPSDPEEAAIVKRRRQSKADNVEKLRLAKAVERLNKYGWVIQPISQNPH
jgi:hypothetical protein